MLQVQRYRYFKCSFIGLTKHKHLTLVLELASVHNITDLRLRGQFFDSEPLRLPTHAQWLIANGAAILCHKTCSATTEPCRSDVLTLTCAAHSDDTFGLVVYIQTRTACSLPESIATGKRMRIMRMRIMRMRIMRMRIMRMRVMRKRMRIQWNRVWWLKAVKVTIHLRMRNDTSASFSSNTAVEILVCVHDDHAKKKKSEHDLVKPFFAKRAETEAL